MDKYFIKVATVYAPKNKLAKMIQEALEPLNQTLNDGKKETRYLINKAFMDACRAYLNSKGKAMLPDFNIYEFKNGFGISVDSIIIINVFKVLEHA